MPSNNQNRSVFSVALSLLLLLLILLSGCASKRWSDPIASKELGAISEVVLAMQEREARCPQSMDTEARIFLDSPGTNTAVHGYLQTSSPSLLKFVVSNPLGMLVYAFASDGKTFQILDTAKRLHIRGNIRPFAIRRDLPLVMVQGDWFAYLNQRLPTGNPAIRQVTRDLSDQTFWLQFAPSPGSNISGEQWLHLDSKQQRVLGYLFLDRGGDIVAEIRYADEEEVRGKQTCRASSRNIGISELPWGTEIRIELRDIRTDSQFSHSDFTLPVPVGYFKQIRP
jgi:outer membrane lipoprotein-sorting protein